MALGGTRWHSVENSLDKRCYVPIVGVRNGRNTIYGMLKKTIQKNWGQIAPTFQIKFLFQLIYCIDLWIRRLESKRHRIKENSQKNCKQVGLNVSKHIPLHFKYYNRSDNKFTLHIFRVLDFHFYPTMSRAVADTTAVEALLLPIHSVRV
jgi:hypothetical protein